MATIKDVAREVGLSVTTVSRALNDHDDVSQGTKQRVQDAARRLDYHPNVVARSLQNQSAGAIGLLIPRVLHRTYDSFWLEFIGGMATACAERGVDIMLSSLDIGDRSMSGFNRLMRSGRVDGLVICDVVRSDPRISLLQKHRFPFVAFGRMRGEQHYSYIDVDGAAGVALAIDRLAAYGHRRIAYLGLDPAFGFSYFRLQGYREAMLQNGLVLESDLICEGLTERSAAAQIVRLLDRVDRPTAIFAAADFLALAALRVARTLGLAVPGDLSIVVFDDNPMVQHADPPLTAVSQPNRRIGEEVAGLLLDRLGRTDSPVVQRLIVPALLIRESTAVPPAVNSIAVAG
jgi:LacI family transcriptional regulator, galactose operon repressor